MKIAEPVDRVFCIYSEQAPAKGGMKAEAKMPGAQDAFGAILMR